MMQVETAMNIFARAVFWAVPVWILLMLLHYATWFIWIIHRAVDVIIYPGSLVCLWWRGSILDVDWFSVIVINMVIYYLVIVLVLFVHERLSRSSVDFSA